MSSAIPIFVVAFLASLLGPICGIGGGVIIKPVVDAMSVLPIATVYFLSSISVLTMSLATLAQNALTKTSTIKLHEMLPLALGSAVGGVGGKVLFNLLMKDLASPRVVGSIQAIALIVLTACVFVYTMRKHKVKNLKVEGPAMSGAIGAVAGACWAFLGIGGGPFNLAILMFFFSMESKPSAQASLFIIAFSQTASLLYSILQGSLPTLDPFLVFGMCTAAVAGSVVGRQIARRVDSAMVERLYRIALVVVILISAYNFMQFNALL